MMLSPFSAIVLLNSLLIGFQLVEATLPRVSRVRLVNGRNSNEGRIEVLVGSTWGTVCDDGFDLNDARVFCRMLGYTRAQRALCCGRPYGQGSGQIWLDDLACTGRETSINQCRRRRIGSHNCRHSEDAGVVCAQPATVTRVRLANGKRTAGRVEVLVNGRWGTVCDDGFGIADAHVFCRMLGFPGAKRALSGARPFGQGTGPIWLDDLACTGRETSINQCRHRRIGSHNCRHSEDAGVVCLTKRSCGYSPRAPHLAFDEFRRVIGHTHVIGGNNARPGTWPWQAALYRNGRFICGGSLIKADWILTAAHCLSNRNPSVYRIVLGDHDRNRNEGTEQSLTVRRVIVHPSWNSRTINNDVALLQLSRPATLNNRVGIVCLPSANVQVPVGSRCYITGWGKIRHPGNSHNILQEAVLPVADSRVCQRKLKASPGGHRLNITPQMVCGGKEGLAVDACHGDSGGPYVCRRRGGSWSLEGVVSWGSPRCNGLERFAVFARISQFRRWIDGHIGRSK